MRTITVNTKNGPLSITTDLTIHQASETLKDSKDDFIQSLQQSYRQFGDRISEGRANWLIIKAQQQLDRTKAPQTHIGNLTGIFALFNTAYNHGMKRPTIRLQTQDGTPIRIFPAPKGNIHHGKINISKGPYGSGFWGRIDDQGNTTIKNPEVITLLKALITDPAGVAKEYGKLTGGCCFCDLPLTDERSLHVGYGPICAEHYDLPWGEKPTQPIIDQITQDAGLSTAILNHGIEQDEPNTRTQDTGLSTAILSTGASPDVSGLIWNYNNLIHSCENMIAAYDKTDPLAFSGEGSKLPTPNDFKSLRKRLDAQGMPPERIEAIVAQERLTPITLDWLLARTDTFTDGAGI